MQSSKTKSKNLSSGSVSNKIPKPVSTMFPSASSAFTTYASVTASLMLIRSIFNDLIPYPLRRQIMSALSFLFRFCSGRQTVVIEQSDGIEANQVFMASEVYLSTKISPDTRRLRVSKRIKDRDLSFKLNKGQRITDSFQGIELNWRHICYEYEKKGSREVVERRYFELSFKKKYREIVLDSYLPFVLKSAEMIESETRVLKIHTLANAHYSCKFKWESVKLEHPANFDTLALDGDLKNMIIEDLNRFLRRKEFYKRVGRSWKRGYLFYGPPGTDGLWSSCGDERIIVFTTNHKERLDPALLRPGRMDMHINLSYCTFQTFRILASNYLEIKGEHHLFKGIEELLENTKVTPAQVAEELMKNEDADIALEGFLSFLKQKKLEQKEAEEKEAAKKLEIKELKEQKIECNKSLKKESIPVINSSVKEVEEKEVAKKLEIEEPKEQKIECNKSLEKESIPVNSSVKEVEEKEVAKKLEIEEPKEQKIECNESLKNESIPVNSSV
ncbi:hypothetical protein COLO4_22024 [Corchorus olitorius]|uniref:Uncharacterized protein n=1 Tax=Corchorus olitorius TaxID=93759 RepID=A0A1R3IPH2_9ROSI|nr:hypothetical protein COLO4_22024 [Corchorus olitorius]